MAVERKAQTALAGAVAGEVGASTEQEVERVQMQSWGRLGVDSQTWH